MLTSNPITGGAFMKMIIYLLMVTCLFAFWSCEKVSKNAVELSVDFSWEGINQCGWGNPTIFLDNVPKNTKYIKIQMYDHAYAYDHGEVIMPFDGEKIIKNNRFDNIQGPCPPHQPGEYEITIKALDGNKVVIGKGSRVRHFPE